MDSEKTTMMMMMKKNELDGETKNGEMRVKDVFFENSGLLKIGDLSFLMQVPVKTIRDWVYKRQIPFVKVGNLIRFRLAEIERWINRGGYPCTSKP